MKEIIYNNDNLKNNEITEVVIRAKALIINNGNILLANEDNKYHFPGGHLEENESLEECLRREILEETGISIEDNEINETFMKVTFMNRDWPEKGKNRKAEIYYYAIKTNKIPDISKTNYTDNEKNKKFRIDIVPLNKSIKVIKDNIPNNEMNKVIAPDMIMAIEEYLKKN